MCLPQPHPNDKRLSKWLSEEALQIAVNRRSDKKAVHSNQCKEIEENNRMGKTRGLFKKIRDTKGTFHAKMGSIKDRRSFRRTEGSIRSSRT